jgi:hypothetical protein
MQEIYLNELPETHPLRNKGLHSIGAYYQLHPKGSMWHEVREPYGIAKATYNQLAPVWTVNHTWKATRNLTGDIDEVV